MDLDEELRFHDLPGRGPHAGRLSHASLAVNAVQGGDEFASIHAGASLAGHGPSGVSGNTWSREPGRGVVVVASPGPRGYHLPSTRVEACT